MMETNEQTGKPANAHAVPMAPAIVLVEPQLGENIGFAARAMGNFGLRDLRLVTPRDGWPNEKACAAAAVAEPIVSGAKLFETVAAALADRNFVVATTARPREMVKPVFSPESAAASLRKRAQSGERCAVMFGGERNGLDNESITLADAILTAPVDPNFASLSLPQAVLLFSYEWMKGGNPEGLGRATLFDGPAREGLATPGTGPATRASLFGLFDHMEGALDAAGFLRPPEKRPAMVRSIRNMLHRMECTEQDVRTWRGIISAFTRHSAASKG